MTPTARQSKRKMPAGGFLLRTIANQTEVSPVQNAPCPTPLQPRPLASRKAASTSRCLVPIQRPWESLERLALSRAIPTAPCASGGAIGASVFSWDSGESPCTWKPYLRGLRQSRILCDPRHPILQIRRRSWQPAGLFLVPWSYTTSDGWAPRLPKSRSTSSNVVRLARARRTA